MEKKAERVCMSAHLYPPSDTAAIRLTFSPPVSSCLTRSPTLADSRAKMCQGHNATSTTPCDFDFLLRTLNITSKWLSKLLPLSVSSRLRWPENWEFPLLRLLILLKCKLFFSCFIDSTCTFFFLPLRICVSHSRTYFSLNKLAY